jgi:hypothetical protein
MGAGLSQSIYCLNTDWTTGRSRFDPRKRQRIFPVASVQTSPKAHPASCPMGTGGPFAEEITAVAWRWPLTPMSKSYTSSPPGVSMVCRGTILLYTSCSGRPEFCLLHSGYPAPFFILYLYPSRSIVWILFWNRQRPLIFSSFLLQTIIATFGAVLTTWVDKALLNKLWR